MWPWICYEENCVPWLKKVWKSLLYHFHRRRTSIYKREVYSTQINSTPNNILMFQQQVAKTNNITPVFLDVHFKCVKTVKKCDVRYPIHHPYRLVHVEHARVRINIIITIQYMDVNIHLPFCRRRCAKSATASAKT